jgi:hypothetical protein
VKYFLHERQIGDARLPLPKMGDERNKVRLTFD